MWHMRVMGQAAIAASITMAGCQVQAGREGRVITAVAMPQVKASAADKAPVTKVPQKREASLAQIDALIARLQSLPDSSSLMLEMTRVLSANSKQVVYLRQVCEILERSLAEQLRVLNNIRDPEASLRVMELLTFVDSVNQFLADALMRPEKEREALLKWGLDHEHVEVLALAYGKDVQGRVGAIKRLEKLSDPEADVIMAALIDDLDREVSLLAMEATSKRQPTQVLVDALWNRAVKYPAQAMGYGYIELPEDRESIISRVEVNTTRVVYVHGRPIGVSRGDQRLSQLTMDNDVATDLLVGMKSPMVAAKLVQFIESNLQSTSGMDANTLRGRLLSPTYGGVAVNLNRLLGAYQPPETVAPLLKSLVAMPSDGYTQLNNNRMFRYSTRIDLMVVFLDLVGLEKAEYNIVRNPNLSSRWIIDGGDVEEEKAVKKLMAWWGEHYKEYGATNADLPEMGSGGGGSIIRFRGE